ncbi:hypothetical protein [Nocardia sp. NPDC059228]|uniref:hypothetical protein n=1 Tax=Nocardia sp. NPDC059228 TaxID=3346777 RepID=UPI0036CF05F5
MPPGARPVHGSIGRSIAAEAKEVTGEMMKNAALMALRFFVAFEIASVVANLAWHEISFEAGDLLGALVRTALFAAPAAVIAAGLWWRVSSETSSESRVRPPTASGPPREG